MKKTILLFSFILFATLTFSQKNEKLKGSKIVTLEQKEIENFNAIEISDDLDVFLVKADKCSLEIEADDNLHDAIAIAVTGSILQLNKVKKISSFKKFSIRINYTDDLKLITGKGEAKVTALAEVNLDSINFKLEDHCKFFGNIRSKVFNLEAVDKAKAELNIKSEKSTISLSKDTELKALISSNELTLDLYQKAEAIVEGDVIDFTFRLDNNSKADAKKLSASNVVMKINSYSEASVNALSTIIIEATGKSKIDLYGEPKIDLKRFEDNSTLSKKPSK